MATRLVRTLSAVVGAGLLAAGLVGSSAQAAGDPPVATADGGWTRYPAADFTSPAGDLCSFALQSTVVFDQVYVRTTATFSDGRPRREEYVGPLVVELTNVATGRSITRDLSGRAVLTYGKDGSYDYALSGPAAIGFRPGDSLRRGYYVLRGEHVIHFAADGVRTITRDRGTEENTCKALR